MCRVCSTAGRFACLPPGSHPVSTSARCIPEREIAKEREREKEGERERGGERELEREGEGEGEGERERERE